MVYSTSTKRKLTIPSASFGRSLGEVLSLSKLNMSSLRLAIERVLTEKSYTKNARRIQQSIQLSGGVARAANIIEQVIQVNRITYSVSHMGGIPVDI